MGRRTRWPSALAIIVAAIVIAALPASSSGAQVTPPDTYTAAPASAVFAGPPWAPAQAPDAHMRLPGPSITMTTTVGLDPNTCATEKTLLIPSDTESDVTYCYTVINTGDVDLTQHTLEDSELGTLLSDAPFTLAPQASHSVTATTALSATTVTSATWTAFNPGPTDVVSDTDTVTVTTISPSIVLTTTVGLETDACAPTSSITVTLETEVTYCYHVTNTGNISLTLHDLEDSELGTLLDDSAFDLEPGASTFVTETATVTLTAGLSETTVTSATWTAFNPGPTDVVSDTDSVTVTVTAPISPSIALTTTVGLEANACAPTDNITVTLRTVVTYCYRVTNTGDITLTLHDLEDSELGAILEDFAFELEPGASTFVTETALVTPGATLSETLVTSATWTARYPALGASAADTDTARITVLGRRQAFLPIVTNPTPPVGVRPRR